MFCVRVPFEKDPQSYDFGGLLGEPVIVAAFPYGSALKPLRAAATNHLGIERAKMRTLNDWYSTTQQLEFRTNVHTLFLASTETRTARSAQECRCLALSHENHRLTTNTRRLIADAQRQGGDQGVGGVDF